MFNPNLTRVIHSPDITQHEKDSVLLSTHHHITHESIANALIEDMNEYSKQEVSTSVPLNIINSKLILLNARSEYKFILDLTSDELMNKYKEYNNLVTLDQNNNGNSNDDEPSSWNDILNNLSDIKDLNNRYILASKNEVDLQNAVLRSIKEKKILDYRLENVTDKSATISYVVSKIKDIVVKIIEDFNETVTTAVTAALNNLCEKELIDEAIWILAAEIEMTNLQRQKAKHQYKIIDELERNISTADSNTYIATESRTLENITTTQNLSTTTQNLSLPTKREESSIHYNAYHIEDLNNEHIRRVDSKSSFSLFNIFSWCMNTTISLVSTPINWLYLVVCSL